MSLFYRPMSIYNLASSTLFDLQQVLPHAFHTPYYKNAVLYLKVPMFHKSGFGVSSYGSRIGNDIVFVFVKFILLRFKRSINQFTFYQERRVCWPLKWEDLWKRWRRMDFHMGMCRRHPYNEHMQCLSYMYYFLGNVYHTVFLGENKPFLFCSHNAVK